MKHEHWVKDEWENRYRAIFHNGLWRCPRCKEVFDLPIRAITVFSEQAQAIGTAKENQPTVTVNGQRKQTLDNKISLKQD